MKNTMCIDKCNKHLSNKPSNGTVPKYKNTNLRTEVSLHTSTHLGNQKASFFFPHKNTDTINTEIQLTNSNTL